MTKDQPLPVRAGIALLGVLGLGVSLSVAGEPDPWRAAGSSPGSLPRSGQARLGPPVTAPKTPAPPTGQVQTSKRDSVVEQVFAEMERRNETQHRRQTASPAPQAPRAEGKGLVVRGQAPQPASEEILLPPPPSSTAGAAPEIEPASPPLETAAPADTGEIKRTSLPVVMSPTVGKKVQKASQRHAHGNDHHGPAYTSGPGSAPHECAKTLLPPYVIEPPDILTLQLRQAVPDKPLPAQVIVRPDGTISLGLYGSIAVAGMTIDQARAAIEQKLVKDVKNPEVSVDVFAYNSKWFYVVTDGGGYGEQVIRIPITGNETVLDAISQINGLPAVASKKHIWLARSNCFTGGQPEILPVDWNGIVQRGMPQSNYQLIPGDRLYVRSDKLVRFDSAVAKVISPFERMFGFTLLGNTTVQNLRSGKRAGTGGGF